MNTAREVALLFQYFKETTRSSSLDSVQTSKDVLQAIERIDKRL
jgi:hypothetical protein